jgi:hypothetical protein
LGHIFPQGRLFYGGMPFQFRNINQMFQQFLPGPCPAMIRPLSPATAENRMYKKSWFDGFPESSGVLAVASFIQGHYQSPGSGCM